MNVENAQEPHDVTIIGQGRCTCIRCEDVLMQERVEVRSWHFIQLHMVPLHPVTNSITIDPIVNGYAQGSINSLL